MTNSFKLILSKIIVAQKSKKKILKIKISFKDLLFLEVLWKNGLINGYNKKKDGYIIFLRYNLNGVGILNSLLFLDIELSKKELKNFLSVDPNYNYLVITSKGLCIYSTYQLVSRGCKTIAKF